MSSAQEFADRYRQEGYWDVQCPQCEKWFEAARYSATFCSGKCRTAYHRAEKKAAQARAKRIAQAQAAITDLATHLPRRGESQELLALQQLETLIKKAIAQVET